MRAFKQPLTPNVVKLIVREGTNMLDAHRPDAPCLKVCYETPAAAKKSLRNHRSRHGVKSWYKCPHHGAEEIYHLTSMKQPKREK